MIFRSRIKASSSFHAIQRGPQNNNGVPHNLTDLTTGKFPNPELRQDSVPDGVSLVLPRQCSLCSWQKDGASSPIHS